MIFSSEIPNRSRISQNIPRNSFPSHLLISPGLLGLERDWWPHNLFSLSRMKLQSENVSEEGNCCNVLFQKGKFKWCQTPGKEQSSGESWRMKKKPPLLKWWVECNLNSVHICTPWFRKNEAVKRLINPKSLWARCRHAFTRKSIKIPKLLLNGNWWVWYAPKIQTDRS